MKTTRKVEILDGPTLYQNAFNSLVGNELGHILSIGFEFETKKLFKLTSDKTVFYINNDANTSASNNEIIYDNDVTSIVSESSWRDKNSSYKEIFGELENDGDEPNRDVVMTTTSDISKQNKWERTVNKICSKSGGLILELNQKTILIKLAVSEQPDPPCPHAFPSVEWKILYSNPPRGSNVILQCFTDACARIYRHLQEFTMEKGRLTNHAQKKFAKVIVFTHTNETYPKYITKGIGADVWKMNKFDIGDIKLRPQLTFCVKVEHLCAVVKQLHEQYYKVVEKLVSHLLRKHASKMNELLKEQLRGYLCMFFDMITKYVQNEEIRIYLKDRTSFMPRHDNAKIYLAMSVINPNILDILFDHEVGKVIYKGRAAFTRESLNADPKISYRQYIKRIRMNRGDFLRYSRASISEAYPDDILPHPTYDDYSTQMELKGGKVLVEWRGFFLRIENLAKPLDVPASKLSLNDYLQLPERLKETVTRVPPRMRWNRETQRYVNMCPAGTRRQRDWTCRTHEFLFDELNMDDDLAFLDSNTRISV